MLERTRSAASHAVPQGITAYFGEVADYQANGQGSALIWVTNPHADDPNQKFGPMPLCVPWAGNKYGQLGGVEQGTQVLVLSLGPDGDAYVAIGFFNTQVRPSQPVPSKECWWVHANGPVLKLTNDGPAPNDAKGGTQVGGGGKHQTFTQGGHHDTFTDLAGGGSIVRASAGGHTDSFSDVTGAAAITRAASDGSSKTVHDAIAHEVSHLGANVTLGARAAAMTSVNAGLNKSHLSTYETNRAATNLVDLIANANLMHTAGIISAGQLATMLAALVAGFTGSVTLPSGSGIVKLSS